MALAQPMLKHQNTLQEKEKLKILCPPRNDDSACA